MRVLPGLLKRIRRPNLLTLDVKRRTDFVDRAKVPELPVLDLDDQQATTGMKNQEVRVLMRGTYRNVVPADVVIFQVRLQPPREAALAGSHPTYCARKDGDEVR